MDIDSAFWTWWWVKTITWQDLELYQGTRGNSQATLYPCFFINLKNIKFNKLNVTVNVKCFILQAFLYTEVGHMSQGISQGNQRSPQKNIPLAWARVICQFGHGLVSKMNKMQFYHGSFSFCLSLINVHCNNTTKTMPWMYPLLSNTNPKQMFTCCHFAVMFLFMHGHASSLWRWWGETVAEQKQLPGQMLTNKLIL